MTLTADTLPDSAPLRRDLLERVSERRRTSDTAEAEILELAVEYTHANPALPGQEAWQPAELPSWLDPGSYAATDPEDVEWHGLPSLRWDAPAAFAAANDMTTTAGKALIRDALVLVHRAPGVWAALKAGMVPAWRARKIAQVLLGQHDDVCAYVNRELTDRITSHGAIGPVVVERLVDEAMLRLHAEERELDQLEALDRRHVTVDDGHHQPPRDRRPGRPAGLGRPGRPGRQGRRGRRGPQAPPRARARVAGRPPLDRPGDPGRPGPRAGAARR